MSDKDRLIEIKHLMLNVLDKRGLPSGPQLTVFKDIEWLIEEVETLRAKVKLWERRAEFLRKLYVSAAKDGSLTWEKIDKVMAEDN